MATRDAPTSESTIDILSLKVTLRGSKPPTWRRLLVPDALTLGALHKTLQAAMGWEDCHLHAVETAGEQYGDRRTVDDMSDENRVTLDRLVRSGIARFPPAVRFGKK